MGLECSGRLCSSQAHPRESARPCQSFFAADGANLALTDLASKKTPGCLVKWTGKLNRT